MTCENLQQVKRKLTCHQFISSHLLASQLEGKQLWKRKGCNYISVIIGGWYTKIENLIKKIGQNVIHEIIQTNTYKLQAGWEWKKSLAQSSIFRNVTFYRQFNWAFWEGKVELIWKTDPKLWNMVIANQQVLSFLSHRFTHRELTGSRSTFTPKVNYEIYFALISWNQVDVTMLQLHGLKNHGDIELQKSLLVQTPDHINLMMLQLWHSCCPFNYWIYKG